MACRMGSIPGIVRGTQGARAALFGRAHGPHGAVGGRGHGRALRADRPGEIHPGRPLKLPRRQRITSRLYRIAPDRYLPQPVGMEFFSGSRGHRIERLMRQGVIQMKSISLVACAAAVLAGCSVNGSTPVTAWGKKDVSMLDYRTDAGQCAVLATTKQTETDAAKQAGGINGQNSSAPAQAPSGGQASAGTGGATGARS